MRFEYECQVHGAVITHEAWDYETCPVVREDVRCALPLSVTLIDLRTHGSEPDRVLTTTRT